MKQIRVGIVGGLGALAVLLVLGVAAPVAAQDAPKPAPATSIDEAIERSGIVPALEAIAAAATPELERALGQLATTLGERANRIARDPELRASAVQAARGATEVAELVVIEQSSALQEALRRIADRIDELAAARERRD
jgi:hypothetical protein